MWRREDNKITPLNSITRDNVNDLCQTHPKEEVSETILQKVW